MRFEQPLEEGRLLRRYKRFLADIESAGGERLTIHCPNTGSMLNCMSEGCRVWFSRSNDPKRKLPGTWELSETPQGRLACVNTARANRLVEEALLAGTSRSLPVSPLCAGKWPTAWRTVAPTFAWNTPRAHCSSR